MPQDVTTSMSTSWGGKEITNVANVALTTYANATDGKGRKRYKTYKLELEIKQQDCLELLQQN
ncbi:MAG: hypothetical protein CM15mV4_0730 [Caudoviricetes sp.]|nr:MAG: hypothetical protein CM15mV4_0730 [Caudoviricetes sp.]